MLNDQRLAICVINHQNHNGIEPITRRIIARGLRPAQGIYHAPSNRYGIVRLELNSEKQMRIQTKPMDASGTGIVHAPFSFKGGYFGERHTNAFAPPRKTALRM